MIPFDQAIALLKTAENPVEKICHSSAYWATLQLLYVELVKNKELVRLSELPKDEREKYWQMVKDMDAKVWKKISIAQALYCYARLPSSLK